MLIHTVAVDDGISIIRQLPTSFDNFGNLADYALRRLLQITYILLSPSMLERMYQVLRTYQTKQKWIYQNDQNDTREKALKSPEKVPLPGFE